MKKQKLMAALTALTMLGSAIPAVQATAAEDEVAALVKAADEANADYSVVMHTLDAPAEEVYVMGDGYAQLYRYGDGSEKDTAFGIGSAIIDKDGTLLFPYSEGGYTYTDGYVTCGGGLNMEFHEMDFETIIPCTYYTPDGTPLLSFDNGTPMSEGIAVVGNYTDVPEIFAQYFDDEDLGSNIKAMDLSIIDKDGNVLYQFPKEMGIWDNEYGYGLAHVGMMFIEFGECSEGLIPFTSPIQFDGSFDEPVAGDGVPLGMYDQGYFEESYYSEEINLPYQMAEHPSGYADAEGNIIIAQQFDEVFPFYGDYALVLQDEKYGLINKSGEFVIEPEYFNLSPFLSDGLLWAGKDGYYGYINEAGEVVIPMQYSDVYNFYDGYAGAINEDYMCGIIDKNGEEVLPFEYERIYSAGDGLFVACKMGEPEEDDYYGDYIYGLVDKNGQDVLPMIFDHMDAVDGVVYATLDEQVYRFEVTAEGSAEVTLPGDVNGDGDITSADAAAILLALAEMGAGGTEGLLTPEQTLVADVNQSGKLETADSAFILLYIAIKGVNSSDFTVTDVVNGLVE